LPIQDPVSAAARGLIPVQFDFASFHNAQDHRSEKSRNDKIVPPNVQSVCNRQTPTITKVDKSTSVGELRIEPHSRRSVTGERSD
jgi:hypothetical protein